MVGLDTARRALLLACIEPRLSGVLLVGAMGAGKSALLNELRTYARAPVVRIPLAVDEERLCGAFSMHDAMLGIPHFEAGLLEQANGGWIIIDDVSAMPDWVLAIIFSVQERGMVDTPCGQRITQFRIAMTLRPEEGGLNPHWLDRIDLCAVLDTELDTKQRQQVIRQHLVPAAETHADLHAQAIRHAQLSLPMLSLDSQQCEELISKCIQANAAGHRAERAAFLATRAYAALLGDAQVTADHLETVLPLVLTHRMRETPPPPEDESSSNTSSDDQKSSRNPANESSAPSVDQQSAEAPKQEAGHDSGTGREDIFHANRAIKIRRLSFDKDRLLRTAVGRRTPTRTDEKRGRTLRTSAQKNDDIAIAATICHAAPYQRVRGRKAGDRLIIRQDDIQTRERENRMSHTLVLILDASGSMGVAARMREAKSACLGILKNAYIQRDQVAIVAFRAERAELLVPPTRSGAKVIELLNDLPTGGKTPLALGLSETYRLIKSIHRKEPKRRIVGVIMTDGKANSGAAENEKPWETSVNWARSLRTQTLCDWIVVDTEKTGLVRLSRSRELATVLDAPCWSFDELGEGGLATKLAAEMF